MRNEFGQMALYPDVRIGLRGNIYTIEFEIDPRKCDTFNVLATFLAQFNESSDFRLVKNHTMKQ